MKKDHLSLYLKDYAEYEAISISKNFPEDVFFEQTIVIPAYDEGCVFLERLKKSKLSQTPLLVILIINQPDNVETSARNKQLWMDSIKSGKSILSEEHCHLLHWSDTRTHLLIIDCFSNDKRLPVKQGVGLARKIGCDIACALIKQKKIRSQWIHSSDADTYLPDDYLSTPPTNNNSSAAIYAFKHIPDTSKVESPSVIEATLLYEKALNYYVDGLNYAGSSYAYHSLGSCMLINAEAYAQARGFPKRAGGEDFYLLNKLRKLGPIQTLSSKPLLITARASNRAPFGTGPAIKKIIDDNLNTENYQYYNPLLFAHLKTVLMHFELLFLNKADTKNWLNELPQICQDGLIKIGIESLFSHIEMHGNSHEKTVRQIHNWFDGFKTLKFIHFLDRKYKKILLKDAEEKLLNMSKGIKSKVI